MSKSQATAPLALEPVVIACLFDPVSELSDFCDGATAQIQLDLLSFRGRWCILA
jgi:hypothetical protein